MAADLSVKKDSTYLTTCKSQFYSYKHCIILPDKTALKAPLMSSVRAEKVFRFAYAFFILSTKRIA